MCISLRTHPIELSECRRPCRPHTLTYLGAWVTRLWLVTRDCFIGWCTVDDAPLIPPEIHDLYNKDTNMRKLERQLRVLPDLLNNCPIADTPSKVTRVCTLANMLAGASLASSMFSDWGRQAGEDLSHNPCYHCNWGKVLFCPPMHQNLPEMIDHVPAAPQQHNAPQCPQGSGGWIGFAHHRQAVRGRQWTPQAFL